jgi:hypothetical protein
MEVEEVRSRECGAQLREGFSLVPGGTLPSSYLAHLFLCLYLDHTTTRSDQLIQHASQTSILKTSKAALRLGEG